VLLKPVKRTFAGFFCFLDAGFEVLISNVRNVFGDLVKCSKAFVGLHNRALIQVRKSLDFKFPKTFFIKTLWV